MNGQGPKPPPPPPPSLKSEFWHMLRTARPAGHPTTVLNISIIKFCKSVNCSVAACQSKANRAIPPPPSSPPPQRQLLIVIVVEFEWKANS
ncbi:hypothetical protein TYRP_018366 [Tyrophagus putrescentiae]|nr:hypothetical protein TYRP_018366 [Tyrophagus putrescentiae]